MSTEISEAENPVRRGLRSEYWNCLSQYHQYLGRKVLFSIVGDGKWEDDTQPRVYERLPGWKCVSGSG